MTELLRPLIALLHALPATQNDHPLVQINDSGAALLEQKNLHAKRQNWPDLPLFYRKKNQKLMKPCQRQPIVTYRKKSHFPMNLLKRFNQKTNIGVVPITT